MNAITRADEVAARIRGAEPPEHAPGVVVSLYQLRDGFLAAQAELEAVKALGEYIDSRCVDDTNPCHLSCKKGEWYFCDWEFYPEHLNMGGDSFMEANGTGVEILAEIERLKCHRAELQADYDREQEDDDGR